MPNIEGFRFQKPYSWWYLEPWYLEPECFNIGYLDPLADTMGIGTAAVIS